MSSLHKNRMVTAVICAMTAILLVPAAASACSTDDTSYLDSFLEQSCLQSTTNTALDAQGGVRLTTNGTPVSTNWDTDTDFDDGVTYSSILFPPFGVSTLARSGTGAAAVLELPTSNLALDPGTSSVLAPTTSAVLDNDQVEDPSVIKVGSTFVMYYAGTPESGGAKRIFQATSTDAAVWTRANGGLPVLSPDAGAFDEFGVSGPEVIHDAMDVTAPYKMWFSGQGSTFGAIGYATSVDGVNWIKYDGGGPDPVPVLDHGAAGSADSFAAADPSVIKDGTTMKMWYTGDDSNKKRIAYATSPDGIVWSKGGKVIAPEDPGVSANLEYGAFAPTVWKVGNDYNMLLAGRKIVAGDEFQTKILNSTSTDGITWSGPSPSINPSGSSAGFDYSNLDGPDVFVDTGAPTPYKAFYAGNTIDANGNFHTRIGAATSMNGSSFSKVSGGQAGGSVLDISASGTAFDARSTSGVSAAAPAGAPAGDKFVGLYAGVRGSDFKSRIGGASSPDGVAWTRFADGEEVGGSLLPLGNAPANFDLGGHRDPHLLYDSADGSPHRAYFTALTTGSVLSIATAATTEDVDKQPVNSAWSTPTRIMTAGSGFDGSGVSHPSVIKDGATYRMYYTGTDGSGVKSIGQTSSATATSFVGARTQILSAGSAGSFDSAGVEDPVAWKAGDGDYRMIYTGISTVDGVTTRRVGYATSADGVTWSKSSPALILDASMAPFSFDEVGVSAAGVLVDGATTHVWFGGHDRTGRVTAGHAVNSASGVGPRGAATYQMGDATTAVRDFREVSRVSSGDVELWMSFLQPYSSAGDENWSGYFPVTAVNNPETLNFLLNVRGVRWQARLKDPGTTPELDSVAIDHAPVQFTSSGSATTDAVAPPMTAGLSGWSEAKINSAMFQPNGGGSGTATVTVLNGVTNAVVIGATNLNTGGDTTVDLAAVSAAANPSLKFVFNLTSADGQATPRINSLQVSYNSTTEPPTLTLASSVPSVIFGQSATLSGTLRRGAAPLANQTVTIESQPGVAVATATTDAAGAFTAAVAPSVLTTYRAKSQGVTAEPTVTVAVAHLVKLTVKRKGTKGYVRGSIGPSHVGLPVTVQKRVGSRWVTVKKVKTTSKSTFSTVATKLKPKGKYQFRATTLADAEHLAGLSPTAFVDPFRVSLTVKRSGRTLAFTGKVSPARKGKTVLIKQFKAGKWATIAKVKLSSRSTFSLKKKFVAGSYELRADMPGDRYLWPGSSAVRRVTVP